MKKLKMFQKMIVSILIVLIVLKIWSNIISNREIYDNFITNIENSDNFITNTEDYDHKDYPPTVILWTGWRSGSTYFGKLLREAHKDTFYSYEPIWPYGLKIFRDESEETETARNYLTCVLRCDMNTHEEKSLIITGKEFYRQNNKLMKAKCEEAAIDCNNATVLSDMCKSANYHLVKVLRLGLVWAHSLLSDPSLNIKIIYLVRDPRPIIRSRYATQWCRIDRENIKDCSDPARVCHHILQDLSEARKLRATFPDRFHFIRYEDLSLDILETVEDLWKRLDFNLTNEQREQINKGENYTAEHTFSWRSSMNYELMRHVQDACTDVLDILGFRGFQNKDDYENYSIPVFTKTAKDIAAWVG